MSTTVELVEVGPRDGLQNERRPLDTGTRAELITRLVARGARRVEAVSFVRPDLVPQMAGAEEVMAKVPREPGVSYIGLVLNRRGAERAARTPCTEVNIVVPVTDAFCLRNQNLTVEAMLGHAAAASQVARDAGMRVSVTLAVAFGCPFSGRVPLGRVEKVLARVAESEPDEIAFADTIGVGVPRQVRALAALAAGDTRVRRLRFHFHNTRNTGYANAAAAARLDADGGTVPGGVVALDASVGGFGGCPFAPAATGNIATEDLLYLLRGEGVPLLGPGTPDPEGLARVGSWLGDRLGSPPQGLLLRAGDFAPTGPADSPAATGN
ncbi:hydroxymethylglutaryl-CoA lyase [Streptomyces sp. SHP 1-2]|uniref:hydroxymethylglutaryl-CoA lyase n=1 Tax=Streptomyces sp. SHP 1-2 TaxID=2769489 RepID=UPI002237DD10|nr:hydroxymethylglutaryl-CoA lyase [Streptomyces sp. SHP 1-2]MCW5251342.1 hydroxymethylglutaryl-CoA lyase [Streptomyces sp. SHP 1-2]